MKTKRRIYRILGVTLAMAIGTTLWTVRGRTQAPGAAAQPPTDPVQPASVQPVRVQRTLVVATEKIVERPQRTRAQVRPPDTAAAPRPMSRARRVLFGSGRHRPEPFPRVTETETPQR